MSRCAYPDIKATTSYRYGCRCDRCRLGKSEANARTNPRRNPRRNHRYKARKAMAERLGMATVDQQREAIKKIFKDDRRVDRMKSEQVTAIYLRLQREGKL